MLRRCGPSSFRSCVEAAVAAASPSTSTLRPRLSTANQDLNLRGDNTRHGNLRQRRHASSDISSSSSAAGRRPTTPRSAPVPGHLPNKPGSAFLSDIDDCFFDRMKVWKDQDGRELAAIPTFRLIDAQGKPVDSRAQAMCQELKQDEVVRMYTTMSLLPQLDNVLYSAQRQGRITFWMTSYGEEAAVIGSAAALLDDDEVFAQYREVGVLLWRGLPVQALMDQVFGNKDDLGRGRQMPNHIGSSMHYFQTIASPLATQIPQAAGAAYALRRTAGREKNVTACFFGEGAASEGDFHAGMNFASTLNCPVVWLARNNGFAISTAAEEQYRGDGLASRGPGYGTLTIRVDGNDALAVRYAVREARRRAVEGSRPVLVELMTYRVGHHSTSDDSGSYRPKSSVEEWTKLDNPLNRMRNYLSAPSRRWWDSAKEEELKAAHRKTVIASMGQAEKTALPPLRTLFEDTYEGTTPVLEEQRQELKRVLLKYSDDYTPWKEALSKVEGGIEGIDPLSSTKDPNHGKRS